MQQNNKKWIYSMVSMIIFIICVSILAYLKLIPTQIKAIPHYDSIGHFMIFGLFGFFAEMAFKGKMTKIFGIHAPLGSTCVAIYACIDEALQITSSARTFDLHDLGFGLLGLCCFYLLSKKLHTK